MSWFKKKKEEQPIVSASLEDALPTEHKASIDIVAHKTAHQEVKRENDEANHYLQGIFKDNHFSLTMYLAAGGQVKQKPKGTH